MHRGRRGQQSVDKVALQARPDGLLQRADRAGNQIRNEAFIRYNEGKKRGVAE